MKKSLILGILGLTAGAVSSYGQGAVFLDNYQSGTYNPVVFSAALGGATVPVGYTVQLWYDATPANIASAVNSAQSSDSSHTALPSTFGSLIGATGYGTAAIGVGNGVNPGYFQAGGSFLIQPGSATPAQSSYTFMLVAYNGADYADSTIRGYSTAVYETSANPSSPGADDIGSYYASGTPLITVFSVAPVPEPSSLALAGLGGFGMLMAFRRKKA